MTKRPVFTARPARRLKPFSYGAVGLLCFLTAVSATAKGRPDEAAANNEKVIMMRIGHAQPVTHPRHASLLYFKDLVTRRSGGAIAVNIFPAAQLGDEEAMLIATQEGRLEGTRGGLFELVSPRFLVYTLPFLFDSLDAVEKVTMGPIGDTIAAEAEKNSLIVLTTGDAGGFRHISNNIRPIIKPEDFQGLRFRAPNIKTIVKTLEAFGSQVLNLPYGDTYAALESGLVDGQENPFVNIEAMRFYEVQKYLTVVSYQFHPDPFCVNLSWYQSLSVEHQKILKDCAVESMRYNNRLVRTASISAYETLRNSMEVVELTSAQRQAFKDKALSVYPAFIAEGITTQAEIDKIRATAKL